MTNRPIDTQRRLAMKIGAAVLALGVMGAAGAQAADSYRFGLAMPLSGRSAL